MIRDLCKNDDGDYERISVLQVVLMICLVFSLLLLFFLETYTVCNNKASFDAMSFAGAVTSLLGATGGIASLLNYARKFSTTSVITEASNQVSDSNSTN